MAPGWGGLGYDLLKAGIVSLNLVGVATFSAFLLFHSAMFVPVCFFNKVTEINNHSSKLSIIFIS